MEMFLMLFAMSLLGTAVSAALFAAATREERQQPAPRAEKRPAEPQRFFVSGENATAPASADVPGIGVPSPGPVPSRPFSCRSSVTSAWSRPPPSPSTTGPPGSRCTPERRRRS